LLDEHPYRVAGDLDLGPERRRAALRAVGATSTTDRGNSSSAWTTTP
jgi:hypothetical protein